MHTTPICKQVFTYTHCVHVRCVTLLGTKILYIPHEGVRTSSVVPNSYSVFTYLGFFENRGKRRTRRKTGPGTSILFVQATAIATLLFINVVNNHNT